MKRISLFTPLLALIAGLCASASLRAADGPATNKVPATAEGIVKEIKDHEVALAKAIDAKKPALAVQGAARIGVLVSALPDKLKSLSTDKLTGLKDRVKVTAALADQIGKSSATNDWSGALAGSGKLQSALKDLQTLYAPAAPAVQYTCAMHPEILRTSPGACPICGMVLMEKEKE